MTDATADTEPETRKSSKMPLILGLVAALAGAGGGFYAAFSGMILAPEKTQPEPAETKQPGAMPDIVFVEVEPLTISISPARQGRQLRFRAQLEVPSAYAAEVEKLLPRVVDIINGYLRAVELGDLESAASLTRLRAQLLRRIQIVTGPGRVNDLLIMEFVLN